MLAVQDDVSTAAEKLKPRGGLPTPTHNERLVLAALTLRGRSNISALLATASALGARETESRAFSTQSLRRALEPYVAAGWVLETAQGCECNWGLGPRVLRSFSKQDLAALGQAYVGSIRRGYGAAPTLTVLDAHVKLGLAGGDFEWERALEQLVALAAPLQVTQNLLREPLLGAFDREWFKEFSERQQRRLVRPLAVREGE